jgi:hypothetical protein
LGPLVSRDSDSGRLVTPVGLGALVPVDSCFDGLVRAVCCSSLVLFVAAVGRDDLVACVIFVDWCSLVGGEIPVDAVSLVFCGVADVFGGLVSFETPCFRVDFE